MPFIKAAIRLFNKNLGLNLLIICQLCAAVFLINSMFIFFINQNAEYSISKKLLSQNGGFLMQSSEAFFEDFSGTDNDDVVSARELSEKYPAKLRHCQVSSVNVLSNNNIALLQGIDKVFADMIDIPLKKGVMFTKTESNGNEINAIANFGKIGEDVQILHDFAGTLIPVTVRITGLLPASFPMLDMRSSVNYISDVYTWKKAASGHVLICDIEDLYRLSIQSNLHIVSLFILRNNLAEAETKEIKDDIRLSGMFFDLEDLSHSAEEEAKEKIFMFLPLIVFLILLSATNFAMSIALCSVRSLKDMAIMFLCGAGRKDADKLIFIFSGILCLFAVIGITLLTNFLLPSFIAEGGINNPLVVIGIITVSLSVFMILTLVCSRFSLNQKNIAEILRNEVN